MKRYMERLNRECSKLESFEIRHIPRNENNHIDALTTLVAIHRVVHNKAIMVTILSIASIEETKKMVNGINEIVTPWFMPYFDFLKTRVLPEEKYKARVVIMKARRYIT